MGEMKMAKKQKEQRWISVKSRLPKPLERVLVLINSDDEFYTTVSFVLYEPNEFCLKDVTHWLPIPSYAHLKK
ncbi:hypothetical protein A1D22_05950 [Pasteurellaceae bacterium LFhippo2]|nr:hypothetical protein [Pasteurellaceae bacterium LFhippo2]